MTLSADLALIEKALDALERREVRVLVWGLVDSALSDEEVDEALNEVLNQNLAILNDPGCSITTALDLRQQLMNLALLMAVPGRPGYAIRYRTKMAEGIRLLARLRQLFPGRHEGRDGWIAAPTLVADYRLLWRPRRYPDRNITAAQAHDQIGRHVTEPTVMSAADHWFSKADSSWTLSQFQIDAASRILEGLDTGSPRGTIVAAGTGSGKTLAFYLPALSWLAAQKKADPQSRGVRVLALYPRNELLKDQLAEVFAQSRKFDDYLGRSGAAPISVGVLYGDTPTTLKSAADDWKTDDGVVCPFFRCPSCNEKMRLQQPNGMGDGRLICRCGITVDGSQLRLTRRALQDDPPDVLFTSVEMLNQRMSDSTMRHLFGLGPQALRVPPLMLLDEVHVYAGTYGAQVAHLLRRWSFLTRRRTSFVGLSATIAEGKAFFAALTGMDPAIVEEVSPRHDDMRDEGAEYMLALRGDPVSQAALLSTTIQTLMLASRLVDRRQDVSEARPFAGWRAFAFTDQVDATNRLFYDLLDAEGRTKNGQAATGKHPNGGLAHLRTPGPSLRRYEGGQDWRLTTQIGHQLGTRHKVERTTAYDSGVDNDAEIIVATAALEVGYDDPAVGVVVQHKAPRGMAQFLQRKGRAGRTRHMRPWTIMVLSDYGRDRLAYQAYEQFFDPELPPRELPLANRYVRRMQAVYALVDYLGMAMQAGEPRGSVWRDLSAPQRFEALENWSLVVKDKLTELVASNKFPLDIQKWKALKRTAYAMAPTSPEQARWQGANWISCRLRRRHLVKLLSDLLKDRDATDAFAQFVGLALDVPREEVDALLWDHPRPLLLGAIPTALRRLATDWRSHNIPRTDRVASCPLPEFAPATLFSDLSLPEVRLVAPPTSARQEERYLPVLQALSELAPGKVSRRLDDALWLGPTEEQLVGMLDRGAGGGLSNANLDGHEAVDVDAWYRLEPQVPFHFVDGNQAIACHAYRPVDLLLAPPPSSSAANRGQVLDTSNAKLIWRSQMFGRRTGAVFESPATRVGIARLVRHTEVFTHASQSPATVRRYAVGSKAGLQVRRGRERIELSSTWRFTRQGCSCGVGFEMEVDALCFTLEFPASPSVDLRNVDPKIRRAARTARYTWEAQHGEALNAVESNTFLRAWLAQVFQVAAIAMTVELGCPLDDALDALTSPAEVGRLVGVLTTIFQSPDAPDEEDSTGTNIESTEPRLKKKLVQGLENPGVVLALRDLAKRTLTGPIDQEWDAWLTRVLQYTLGAALLEAIQQICPQIDSDDLVVDLEPGPNEDGSLRTDAQLWISEVNPGGNGLVEQVVDALAAESTQFYRRVEAALGPSEFEIIDAQLRDYLRRIGAGPIDDGLVTVTHAVRGAQSSQEAHQHLVDLRRALVARGQAVFHGYVSALSNRVLRPNTPAALDVLLAELMDRWEMLEVSLGVEVDARVVCALFSTDQRIDHAFAEANFDLPTKDRETWRFSMLMGVIWARGHALRANALPLQARFSDTLAVTERLLLSEWLSAVEVPVLASDVDWLEQLYGRLVTQGRAAISVTLDPDALNAVIALIVTTPVQLEYLNVYPTLVSCLRGQGKVCLYLELGATI